MKAAVFRSYGSPEVLAIETLDKPTPTDDEVLVKVQTSSVNPMEWHAMTGLFLTRLGNGLTRPKDTRLGVDYAGVVEAVGKNVSRFKPGDEVFGARSGAFAEYLCVENHVYPQPANITFEQAGGVAVAAITALQGLRDHGRLQAGQKMLINGASGGVGTFAMQIAKAFGAEVTAVCSTRNVDLIRSLGADCVIDYTRMDLTRTSQRYDLMLDIAGGRPWREVRQVLRPHSTYVIVGAPKSRRWIGPLAFAIKTRLASWGGSPKVIFFIARFKDEDFLLLKEMFERGKVHPWWKRLMLLRKSQKPCGISARVTRAGK